MKDNIGLKQPVLEILGRILPIKNPGLAILALMQMSYQVSA
jgi:hypothetical protein